MEAEDRKNLQLIFDGSMNDAARAAELKRRVTELLQPVIGVMDEANKDGLVVSFQLGKNQFGRNVIGDINVVKPL